MQRNFLAGFVLGTVLVLTLLIGVVAFTPGTLKRVPDCPQEDSCTVDYRSGAWHITKDIP